MNLKNLLKIFSDSGSHKVFVKRLAANDNSKNQVYLGGSFDILNILPIQEIIADSDGKGGGKKTRFKTKLNFYWADDEGKLNHAPDAQLILYPKYPEVRFSGFLKGAKNAPSELMRERLPDRLLFLGVTGNSVIGYVTEPDSELAKEFLHQKRLEDIGIFKAITFVGQRIELDSKGKLLQELKRIHNLGWINARKLGKDNVITPCTSSNCGGLTLEMELGVAQNSRSGPDYLGWEVKQFGVKNILKFGISPITLMTPEPTDGFYADNSLEDFIAKYGYKDKKGREARMNFGGIYKYNYLQKTTELKLVLDGYNYENNKIENTDGYMGLVDKNGEVASSWSFTSLIQHWNTKHANACYIPSLNRKIVDEQYTQQYHYGNKILLGTGTDFYMLLKQIAMGNVYYDPGIKVEYAIEGVRKHKTKRRSQFRIKASNITNLYKKNEIIDLSDL